MTDLLWGAARGDVDALFEIGVERPASLSMSIAQVRETLPAGGGGWVGWGGGGEGLVLLLRGTCKRRDGVGRMDCWTVPGTACGWLLGVGLSELGG